MLEPIYVALLQAAMRHVPDGTLTIDMRDHNGWPDDGQDLILHNDGSTFTATLLPHDVAQARAAKEWAGEADFVTTDPSSGARIMARRVDDDDQDPPRRGLVERFRAARQDGPR